MADPTTVTCPWQWLERPCMTLQITGAMENFTIHNRRSEHCPVGDDASLSLEPGIDGWRFMGDRGSERQHHKDRARVRLA